MKVTPEEALNFCDVTEVDAQFLRANAEFFYSNFKASFSSSCKFMKRLQQMNTTSESSSSSGEIRPARAQPAASSSSSSVIL